jgi:hypothetical protein
MSISAAVSVPIPNASRSRGAAAAVELVEDLVVRVDFFIERDPASGERA